MSTSYTKALLSASVNGRQIALTGTTSPGVAIHVTPSGTASLDEVWLYCSNNGTVSVDVITLWGGTTTADQSQFTVQAASRQLIADGKLLQSNGTISAYTTANGTTAVDGFVNRITSS